MLPDKGVSDEEKLRVCKKKKKKRMTHEIEAIKWSHHLFNKYLWCTHHALGIGNTTENGQTKIPGPVEIIFQNRRQRR